MRKFFTLSFDDGVQQDKVVIDLLRKYGIKAAFNLNSGLFSYERSIEYCGVDSIADYPRRAPVCDSDKGFADLIRIPEDEVSQVYEGFELATHSPRHERITDFSDSDIVSLLEADRGALSSYSSLPVCGHAFPFGACDERVCSIVKSMGFRYARGVKNKSGVGISRFSIPDNAFNFSPTCHQTDDDIECLFDDYLSYESDEDLMFFMWGHSYEIDFYSMKQRNFLYTFEKMLDAAACCDDLIKCTNTELFEYLEGK